MIRFINCVRRRQDLSGEEFRRYWNGEEFRGLFERVVALVQPRRYALNLTLQVSLSEQLREERGTGEPFDGTIELWWNNAAEFIEKFESTAAITLRREMLDFQKQFMDLPNCMVFFTEYDTDEYLFD